MIYQLLKDIEQHMGGKESLTAAERSILERSTRALSTMRNPEDTELLRKDEIIVRFCPATKSPVLAYYDGDGMCSCLHNDTIAEDIEDVKRWLEDTTSETPNDTMSYQTEENILDDIPIPLISKALRCPSSLLCRLIFLRPSYAFIIPLFI